MEKTTNSCSVVGCQRRIKPLYRFPHPKKGWERFLSWIEALQNPKYGGLSPLQIYKRGFVCHRHFKDTDLFGTTKNLKENAVPTLNLPPKKIRVVANLLKIDLLPQNTSDISTIDVSRDDTDRQLVDNSDLILNLPLFDAKLINIEDFKLPLFIPSAENNDNSRQTASKKEDEIKPFSTLVELLEIVEDEKLNKIEVQLSTDSTEVNPDKTICFTEKPYFKSIKCYVADSDKLAEVCRICFHSIIAEEDVIKLYSEDSLMEDETRLKNMLKLVLPDIDLEMYPNVVICKKCVQLLESSYKLKDLWLATETKLQKILGNKETVINREADLILKVKKNKFSDHNYAVTATNLKEQLDEEQTLTDSPLGNSSTGSDNFSKQVKICYPKLNKNNSMQIKPVSSQKRKAEGLGSYICEQCGCIFTVTRKFRRHLLWHKREKEPKIPKERKIMCDICGGLFHTPYTLKRHSRIHAEAEAKCSFCGKELKNVRCLKTHIHNVHTRRSSQCHLCGKEYTSRSTLAAHLLRHNPRRKRHACNICDKKFLFPVLLRNHLRRHASERLLTCDYCEKSMKYEHSLQRHIRTFHMDEGEFVCEFCDKPYWKKVDLQRHTIRVHGCVFEDQKKVVPNETSDCINVPVYEVKSER